MLDLVYVQSLFFKLNVRFSLFQATWWMANQVKKNHAGKSMMITPTSLARFVKK